MAKTHKPVSAKRSYCRDARAIAAAWGATVYDKRGMRAKQLVPVHDAMQRPDFPSKTKLGWLRDEVVAWGAGHIELSKDRRSFIPLKKQTPNGGIGNLPSASCAGPEEDLFLKLTPEELKKANRERLQRNLLIHLCKIPGDPLQKFEIEELITNLL